METETTEYVVHSKKERGFWSNKLGWVYDIESADRYSGDDVFFKPFIVNVPDAEWLPVLYKD